jgi:protein-disulfide isomerase
VLSEYGDRVTFVYKHLPLSIHPQAENAALASECANEQGKFQVYADYLFREQDEWGARAGTQRFKEYAWYLRLDGRKFSQCLESGKYRDKVAADAAEAETFFVSGTPGTFVNGRFFGGVASADELKAAIDEELAK